MKFIFLILMMISTAHAQEIYDLKVKSIKGEEFSMSDFKGKTLLIVNIASQCGYTSQLESLESLYKKYKDQKFVVLGVPTNDFGGQTPEDDKEMLEFCQKNYNVTFPILNKATVEGKKQRELYKYLTTKTDKNIRGAIKWNFEKFLVNKEGKVVARFGSSTKPDDKDFIKTLESNL